MPLGTKVGLGPGDIVSDGDLTPTPNKGRAQHPQFWPMYCGQTAAWVKMPVGTGVDLGLGHIVLHEDPAPPKKRHSSPQFSALVYCGQTDGWIKMPLGS